MQSRAAGGAPGGAQDGEWVEVESAFYTGMSRLAFGKGDWHDLIFVQTDSISII